MIITSLALLVPVSSVFAETMYWPAPPPAAKIQLVATFSSEKDFSGSPRKWWQNLFNFVLGLKEENRLVAPSGLGGDQKKLYITDPGAKAIWLVDWQKDVLRKWVCSDQVKELTQPIDVAVADKRVYVSDSVAGKVFVFSEQGQLLETITGLDRPTGLAIDAATQRLFIADTTAHVIKIFSLDNLELIKTIGERGEKKSDFNFPVHLHFANNRLYVVDSMNFRVQVFDGQGNYQSHFGRLGDGVGDFARPKGVTVDGDGNIYVVDGLMDRVQIFNLEGELLLAVGRTGTREGEFWLPSDIFCSGTNLIYLADTYNHRVQVFEYLGD